MKPMWCVAACVGIVWAAGASARAEPAITVYNQGFAVVRDTVGLDLKAGVNEVRFADTTALLEPDSVILRDPAGQHELRVLEQNYRADPVSEGLLLSLYEGKTIDFLVRYQDGEKIVKGKIVRSGYVPGATRGRGMAEEPIIEVEGQLRFDLPGRPLFPALTDSTILKPTLYWLIETDQPGQFDAELAYVTGGMRWEADYNVVAPETGDVMDMVGWVTIDNQTGKVFTQAKIKLMAGDVSKVRERVQDKMLARRAIMAEAGAAPPVTEKAFEEYHLYTLARPTTLHDRETKQVEFVRGTGVKAERLYIYDGAREQFGGWVPANVGNNPDYGVQGNKKVWVMLEFKNAKENGLGVPLPAGRMRFYRRDTDGQLEFTGENTIDHTPKDELVRLYTGNAFDIVGERKRTDFQADERRRTVRESFEITLRNHKTQDAQVRVVEHLYRWSNWEITAKSDEYDKKDAQTIEFRVNVPADGEKVVTYTVRYWW